MMTFDKRTAATLLLAAASVGHFGAALAASPQDAWIGTWKLDKSKSDFTGDTLTFSKTAGGMYHYSDGGPVGYDFGIDGKSYPAAYGRTTTWTQTGEKTWDSVSVRAGAPTIKIHRQISADDQTMTVTVSGTKPDGSPLDESTVYQRVGSGAGLVGEWRDVKTTEASPETFLVSSPRPGVMRYEIPDWKQSAEGRLDGSDLPLKGPGAPPGMTWAGKLDAAGKLSYVMKYNGKPDMYGVQTLAADSKSYTDVSWTAGKENEKATAVYVKQ